MSGDDESKAETSAERPSRASRPSLLRAPDFGDRYEVRGVLGKGGMGEVYRAFDRSLESEVALKVVSEDDAAALARFRREINLSHRVSHRNVLRVHNLEEHDGLTFLSMELVDGEDLNKLIKREGPLPLTRALALFRQVCEGVAAAHEQGVIHRDLKPQNVLVGAGDAVRVADFGIARSIGDSGMTATGAQVGSPAYMAPEQVRGDAVDERADIYALGVMLYQLATGQPPFVGDTPHAVMEMRLHKPPRPMSEVAPDVPAYVAAIASQCMALSPAERYARVSEIVADLDAKTGRGRPMHGASRARRWGSYVALLVGAGAVTGAIALWMTRPPAETQKASAAPEIGSGSSADTAKQLPVDFAHPALLLIAPVDNHTTDPMFGALDQVFASVAKGHSRVLEVYVGYQLQSLLAHSGKGEVLDDAVAAAVGAQRKQAVTIAHISVAPSSGGFRLAVRAYDVPSGRERMNDRQDARATADVIIASGRLMDALAVSYGESVDPKLPLGFTTNLEAAYEFAQGVADSDAGREASARSHDVRAIELDPNFIAAYHSLGIVEGNLGHTVASVRAFERAHARIVLIPELARHVSEADYFSSIGEFDRAADEYRATLALTPWSKSAASNLSEAYRQRHEFSRALETGLAARASHPDDVIATANVSAYQLNAGELVAALTTGRDAVAAFPRAAYVHGYLAIAQWLVGSPNDASREVEAYRVAEPSGGAMAAADLAIASGRLGAAREILAVGIADDLKHDNADGAELKRVLLAELEARAGHKSAALAAAAQVSIEPGRRFYAAMVELSLGEMKRALATASALKDEVGPESRAESRMLEAEAAHVRRAYDEAIAGYLAARKFSDAWETHYFLARVYLDAKRYADAKTELLMCWQRRGDIALRYDETSELRWVTPVQYDLGRALEALGDTAAAKAAYAEFLAMQPKADAYPMVVDAKARLAKLGAP